MGSTAIIVTAFAVLSAMSLAYGIAEAVILSGSKGVKSEDCTNAAMWYNILVTCILHWISFVSLAVGACFAGGSSDGESKNGGESSLIGVGVAIWSCVIYFETSSECESFLKDAYPYLWNAVLAEIVLFFVVLGLLVLVCCGACGVVCCGSEKSTASSVV